MSKYNKITLLVKPGQQDELIANLLLFGIESFEEISGGIIFYTDDKSEHRTDEIISLLKEKFSDITINVEDFAEKNWNEIWTQSIKPVYIKDKIVIYTSWERDNIDTNIPIKIEIDPKMSFGTGHNETTQLILEMMCDFLDEGDKYMLDFGSGTGILGIAGIKSGMEKVIAIEIDADAIENSKEYFEINEVTDFVKLYNCRLNEIPESEFDLITANIISSVIKQNIRSIYEKLKTNGKLFLSGILVDEKEEMTEFLKKNGFKVNFISEKSEWLGIFSIKQ